MRGSDAASGALFSYVDMEARVPATHPLRTIRTIVNEVLAALDTEFEALYEGIGRQSVAPEREAAIKMIVRHSPGARRLTLGADKGYDTKNFVADFGN